MQPQSGEGLAADPGPIIPGASWPEGGHGAAATVRTVLAVQMAALLAGFVLQWVVLAVCDPELLGRTLQRAYFWRDLWRVLAVGLPPLLLFQAVSGDALYRFAAGARYDSNTATNVLIVLLLPMMLLPIVNLFAIPLISMALWLLARRKLLLIDDDEITWTTPLVIALVLMLATMFAALVQTQGASVYLLALVNGLFAAFFTDAVLVNVVARWKRRGLLAPCERRTFQFSLWTLVTLALGAGVWGLVLVRVF